LAADRFGKGLIVQEHKQKDGTESFPHGFVPMPDFNHGAAHLAEFGIVAPFGRNGVDRLRGIVADLTDKRLPEVARVCVALSAPSLHCPSSATLLESANVPTRRLLFLRHRR